VADHTREVSEAGRAFERIAAGYFAQGFDMTE
jgi:hypothetical protein